MMSVKEKGNFMFVLTSESSIA